MSDTVKVQNTYDKHANSYDQDNAMMERMLFKKRVLFKKLRGRILEIGVGTGNNLPYYHPSAKVVALDFSPQMVKIASDKVKYLQLNNIQHIIVGDIQRLSDYFNANTFDYVTSTCVFCSVPDPIKGLLEVKKILKMNGKLVQIEHGLSNIRLLNFFMKFIDPLTVKLRGFHLARKPITNLENAGFKILKQTKIDPTGIVRFIISKPK